MLSLVCIVVVCTLYYLLTLPPRAAAPLSSQRLGPAGAPPAGPASPASPSADNCPALVSHPADIETSDVWPGLEREPDWLERREFWSSQMEDRYQRRKLLWPQLPLKVIVMPHSHNDPGWLKTVEGYFATATRSIISNMVEKLTEHTNMTFIWTEMSFLSMWWEVALPDQRSKLRALLDSGRLEIPTGGWVMTDEANVELFSMLDQLVEGHAFLRSTFGVRPRSSWSVDSFGHGGAFPYLLAKSGIDNMVIMRIHYAWKEWLARTQQGDFLWKQAWERDGSAAPLCHNFPYDIYSIKHSCGPHPQTCLGFDFRHVAGEYNEFSMAYTPIKAANLAGRAELLLDQYGRTGSLLPHNTVLVPLGDDFRYSSTTEFDQQYSNYRQLMDYINSRPELHASVTFGTLTDYFDTVRARMSQFNTLTGDFHVYSDIFSEGRPAYWSGYYSTRPALKLLSRRLAGALRSAEILYTVAASLETSNIAPAFSQLQSARRHLALFQHHDAITGTSKHFVMADYQHKLEAGLTGVDSVTELAAQQLLPGLGEGQQLRLLQARQDNSVDTQLRVLRLRSGQNISLVVGNTLGQAREEAVTVLVSRTAVCVADHTGSAVPFQLTPALQGRENTPRHSPPYQLVFLASLPALGLATFTLYPCQVEEQPSTQVYCLHCKYNNNTQLPYSLAPLPRAGIQLENQVYKLEFDSQTKQLVGVTNKLEGRRRQVSLQLFAYPSQPFRSGAYLLSVDTEAAVEVVGPSDLVMVSSTLVSGPVYTELVADWRLQGEGGESRVETRYRLHHTAGPAGEAVWVEQRLDLGPAPNLRDREIALRLSSGLNSHNSWYTDQAGLGFIKRERVAGLGLAGNHYPVTQAAFIEDGEARLTLVVEHASGASSLQAGQLEVMLDRRTAYDDGRGMGEGVLDSVPTSHRFWLLLEPRDPSVTRPQPPLPALSPLATLLSRQLDSTPVLLQSSGEATLPLPPVLLAGQPLPCHTHLLNLRSWEGRRASPALLVLHRTAPDCSWASLSLGECRSSTASPALQFALTQAEFSPVSLTGNHPRHTTGPMFSLAPMELASYNVTFT